MRTLSDAQRRARLGRRHRLAPGTRTDDVTAVADSLVALHSSDPVSVHLSVLARMVRPDLAGLDTALYSDRSLVRHHAMRRTLWVAGPATVTVMHAACTRAIAAAERRRTLTFLRQGGFEDPEGWLDQAREQVVEQLREHGPMTTRELGRRVPSLARPIVLGAGTPHESSQGAHTRVLSGLGFDGVLVRTRPAGSWISGAYTWALLQDWLPGGVDGAEGTSARRDLALAWLRAFGPGTTRDLQWWTGWTGAQTSAALAACAAEPVLVEHHGPAWVAPGDTADVAAPEPWVALLPGLDPTVMGWKQRDHYLPEGTGPVWDRNGNAGPTVWVDGRVVGAWGQAGDGTIRVHPLVDVPARRWAQVQEQARNLADLLGEVRFSVRFPGPVHALLRD